MPARHDIEVADGESIVAVHHGPENGDTAEGSGERGDGGGDPADAWIVFSHGFLSDRSGSYEGRCRRAVAEGYHGVRFDFRGCGEADGAFVDQTLSTKVADLLAVVEFFDPDRLVLFGSSFGGTVALHAAPDLASDDAPELVAIATRAPVTDDRTFAEMRATIEREGRVSFEGGKSVDERFFADLDRNPFEDVVEALDCPILIVHGGEDESVAVDDSFEAAAALETDVLLEKVAGEGHRFSETAEERLRPRLFDWLASVEGA